jgi:hypothetical protein
MMSLCCFAQENWLLRRNENGIAVYSRMLSSDKYKEIRVICEFNTTLEKLLKVLEDVNDHKNWVYKTTQSYLINRKGKDTLYYYSEMAVPWPASNRDAVVQLLVSKDSLRNTLVAIRSMPTLLPKKPGIVRVPFSLGIYKISILSSKRLKIDYTLSVDPGGAIPAWLVNYTATMAPYNTFINLKGLVEH